MSQRVSLNELLEKSDIVVLSITADESNRNFMDKDKFLKMKNNAIFLNPSRPFLVNREDFKWALENKLGGAWEDFYTSLTENINKYNLVCTNHIAGGTLESRKKTELLIAHKLKKLYS